MSKLATDDVVWLALSFMNILLAKILSVGTFLLSLP